MYALCIDLPSRIGFDKRRFLRSLLIWLLGACGVFSQAMAALVADYRFEETSYTGTAGQVIDVSGNYYHGQSINSATSTSSGKHCRGMYVAYESSNTSNAINTGMDVNTAIGNTGSISFWYKSNSTEYSERILFDATTASGGRFLLKRHDNSVTAGYKDVDLTIEMHDSGGTLRSLYEGQLFADNEWVHIVVVWKLASGSSASYLKLYVDGSLEDSDSFTSSGGALNSGIGTLYIGDNRSTTSPVVKSSGGTFDSVRIFNHALSAAEVTSEYGTSHSCTYLHHMEVTTSSSTASPGSDVVFTVKACANVTCSSLYTSAVTGNIVVSGVTPTYTTGQAFTTGGTGSTTESVSMTSGTATVALSGLSTAPAISPNVWCGMGVTAASGNSCNLTVAATVHHMELTATSGTSVTCNPITYTVKACANADCSSTYTGGMTGTLSVSGVTVNYPSGAGFSIANGSATTTVSAHATTAGTATASLTGLSITPSNTPQVFCGMGASAASGGSCAISTVDSAFLFDVGNHVSEAEQTVSVSAVRSSNNATVCTPAFASVDKVVKFKCTYSNPGSGTLPVRVADATYNTYGALNSGNSTSAACDLTGRNITMAFNASGVATAKVKYADVGLVGMTARYDGSGSDAGLVMQGSDTFVAAPASFTIAGVPAGNIAAGSNFAASATVTVTAKNSLGTKVSNFGNETPPATATLAFTKYRPTSAYNGTFSGTLGSFSNGVATASTLSWTEVGSGDLSASLTGASYLSSGLTASGSTGSTGAVGPFVPHHFTVGTTNACSSFTYSGQPFTATVTAVNAAGDRTYNYDGTAATNPDFAKTVTLSAATNGGTGSMGSASILPSSFDTGVATVSTPVFTYTTKQTGPTTITVRATDTDGVSSSGYTEGSVALRSGRLKLSNAFGTGESALAMQVQAQYWSGKTWIISAGDSCTSVPANAVALSNYTNAHGAAGSWTTTPSAITISNGLGSLSLSTPSPSGSGTVDVALNLGSTAADNACLGTHPATTAGNLGWLRTRNGNCAATFDRDPAARATFGVYAPETRKTVYVRPMY